MRLAIAATSIAASLLLGMAARAAPLTSHPRLWITGADLPRLQSWAVDANPLWKNGVHAAALTANAYANQHWNWDAGTPDNGWGDTGSTGWEADDTEAYAEMFAFMSLVDPVTANRPVWAAHARVMLMWALNQAAQGSAAGVAFRDPQFITYNRANYWGEAWGLVIDWIYPTLTATDKATIRGVILRWGATLENANTAGFEHPQPVGLLNSKRLLGAAPSQVAAQRQAAQLQLRWAENNYFIGHMRALALLTTAFDDADDAPVKPGAAGSVAALRNDVLGAWLYQAYAVFEDPAVSTEKLGVDAASNRSLGTGYGGLPVEGALYGESVGYLYQALLGLWTAGYTDPATYGPQIGLIDSTHWDRAVDGTLHSVSPEAKILADQTYLGPVYRVAGYGDMLRDWMTDDRIDTMGPMAVHDRLLNPARYDKERWIARNVLEGGAGYLNSRAANVWGNSNASYSILYFLTFDPTLAEPADPRPAMTPYFTMPAIGRVLARSDWTAAASWFTFRCGAETINHVDGDCGQFEFYRGGKWLTKQWSGYGNDTLDSLPEYHNMISVQNSTPQTVSWIYPEVVAEGGQWGNAGNNGDPGVRTSVQDGFAYAQADATNLYNHPAYWSPEDAAMDVKAVVRSIVWLNPDHVIVHDMTTTPAPGRFREFSLSLPTIPSINGRRAVMVNGDQKLTVQSLLPAGAVLTSQHRWTSDPSTEFDRVSEEELDTNRLVITTSSFPAHQRYLTVLQGSDVGVKPDTASLVESTSGSAFDGAVVHGTAVLFPSTTTAFTGVGYSVPDTTTRQIITGLVPGAGYSVTVATTGGVISVTVAPGGNSIADGGGVLSMGFAASTHAPLTSALAPKALLAGAPWTGGF